MGDVVGAEGLILQVGWPVVVVVVLLLGPWAPSDVGMFSTLSHLPPETVIKELVMKLALSFHELSLPSGSPASVQVYWV